MSEPHRITFLASASTTVRIPNTGQSREEAIEDAYADLDTGLCWQCASKVELGDFEAEEDRYDPTAEMRATLDAIRALAAQWANQPGDINPLVGQLVADGRAVLAILDGKAGGSDE
ncbi:hypothetical protein ACFWU5_16595 [Nocardia sp. NPDC058640]|uniref:hypothetical protein n=1 Tax=Nocardia sp. NPDC058640 TaxID=3346571 RepID=UPI00365A4BF1